ncbi:GTP-binding protein [Pseudomonas reactans]|uniref:GTP-binding protein n=1 Tax=Pseudomonas reactans TaxID=117680 RepID=A0ABX2R1J7_9PSED|nr:GTP-binding protein [Pseudomonas reactans]NWD96496.1 GTP-binding protein [Pseudomonas reactans]
MASNDHRTPWDQTHFIILAGALGSGKTTLLEAFINAPGMRATTAVIINEAGAINIDGAILSDSAKGLAMATLSNGCVCCSLTNDLVFTVEELIASRANADLPALTTLVLECSGLSKPGPIIRSLTGLAELRMRVSVVSTLDCSREVGAGGDAEAELAQLAAAQTIVLTKVDGVSDDAREQYADSIRYFNPFATVINETEPACRLAWTRFNERNERPLPPISRITSQAVQHPRINVFHARLANPEWEDVQDWLENVAGVLGERLLRIKALVNDPHDGCVLLQSVGSTFSAARRLQQTSTQATSVVFIVRDSDVSVLANIETLMTVSWGSLDERSLGDCQ